MEELIRRGAEADLYRSSWYGQLSIRKVRPPRSYRHPAIDAEVRRARTLREASLLREARGAGVLTPLVYFVDPVRAEIVMQRVEGPRLKEVVEEDQAVAPSLFREVGQMAARLHGAGIVHGDLTTSNLVLHDGRLVLLDFGLAAHSERIEDQAVDLHVFKQALNSAHSKLTGEAFTAFLEGYQEVAGNIDNLLEQLRDVERRGRYARFGVD